MFKGAITAIVTPFHEDGSVDVKAFKKLIDFQIGNGINGIVPCGTTGESPTLSHEEHDEVVAMTVKYVRGRIPVIAGTGSNCTREAIRMTSHAENAGADACLLVNPYYNKPTQEGLYRHFKAIADSVDFPCIVYNIKGRTGVNVETSTLMRLANDCQNINGVKEASGDINQMREVIRQRPSNFSVLSGDDNMTLELIKSGGDGVISVASNLAPDIVGKMVSSALNGNIAEAEKLNAYLSPLFEAIFIETNPIPIKASLAMKGLVKETYRLPMCEMSPKNREKLKAVLQQMKIL